MNKLYYDSLQVEITCYLSLLGSLSFVRCKRQQKNSYWLFPSGGSDEGSREEKADILTKGRIN